ncbi:MAG: GTP 3',8-cyclase MoaA [Clostridia bacterium]|nr:GTP 3',8-cyclase MoaA [Clostridia bacterium]
MVDDFSRQIDYLRISITDKCNLRCLYCMPEDGMPVMRHEELMSFEEIRRTVSLLTPLGIRFLRLTGGEPLVRKGCYTLFSMLRDVPGVEEMSITTNGVLLKGHVKDLIDSGVSRLNLSLDTLRPGVFEQMTRIGKLSDVLSAMEDAMNFGMGVKINAVPIRDINEEDLIPLATLARDNPIQVRFIELMPIGEARHLKPISTEELLAKLENAFGQLFEDPETHGHGPAQYVKPAGFQGSIGIISALSHEFCDHCNRLRLTSDGWIKPCLNHEPTLNVRDLMRSGTGDAEIREALSLEILHKPERHGFLDQLSDREERHMNQIGG